MRFKKLTISLDAIDLHNTWGFYEGLGFQISGQDVDDKDSHYWMEIKKDGVILMLYQAQNKELLREHAKTGFYNTVLYFEIEDIAPYYQSLKKQGYPVEGLEDTHYGAKEFYLKDPDGHQLTFGEFKNQHRK